MIDLPQPYLLFLGKAHDSLAAKMAIACATWRPEHCVGQLRFPGCNADAGLAERTIAEAVAAGARALVLGVVGPGGRLAPDWSATITEALDLGLDVISGMHDRLDGLPEIRRAADRSGQRLIELRHTRPPLTTGTGRKRTGQRVLSVGTDCSTGKMFTALAIERELRRRQQPVTFRATGQTGMLIAGSGVAIDAVIADFISGAAEGLSPDADADHIDVVEGQGSLFHPAFAGVTTGLIHGSQPDALVLCHEPTRTHMRNLPGQPIPTIEECMIAHERAAHLTNPRARTVAISVNTAALSPSESEQILGRIGEAADLPCVDPGRGGAEAIVDALMEMR